MACYHIAELDPERATEDEVKRAHVVLVIARELYRTSSAENSGHLDQLDGSLRGIHR